MASNASSSGEPPGSDPGAPSSGDKPELRDPRSTGAASSTGEDQGDDGDAPKKPSPLKNPVVRIALLAGAIVLVVAFAVWFFRYWTHGRFVQATNDAYIQADQVSVSTRVSAFVAAVMVADNQTVQAGQVLARLDARDSSAQVARAQASAEQAQSGIAQAQAQIRQQQALIGQSAAQLASARAKAVFSRDEAVRYAPLAASGAETSEKLAQMVQDRDQADASVRQNAAALESSRRQIAIYQAQIASARAQVRQAQAQEASARVDLDATLVRASISGRVGDRQVRVGQYLQAGTKMMSLVPVDALYVTANFKETQLGLMRAGQPVSVKVDALKGETLHGTVDSFSPGTGGQFALIPPNNATGNFTKIVQRVPVRIRLEAGPEARKILVPGLSALVSVDTLGAKSDAQERKEEARAHADAHRRQTRDAIDADRRDHVVGAGTSQ